MTEEVYRLRFFDCGQVDDEDAPEFRCAIEAPNFDEADDLAREKFDIPTMLCCCGLQR